MTEQDIFNAAYLGLKAQGFKMSLRNGGCAYRGLNGLRCAVGHVIPDALYDPEMEGDSAESDLVRKALAAIGADGHVQFLSQLQCVHDFEYDYRGRTAPLPPMDERLREFALERGLTVPADDAKVNAALFEAFKARLLEPVAVTA